VCGSRRPDRDSVVVFFLPTGPARATQGHSNFEPRLFFSFLLLSFLQSPNRRAKTPMCFSSSFTTFFVLHNVDTPMLNRTWFFKTGDFFASLTYCDSSSLLNLKNRICKVFCIENVLVILENLIGSYKRFLLQKDDAQDHACQNCQVLPIKRGFCKIEKITVLADWQQFLISKSVLARKCSTPNQVKSCFAFS
jgi:hypothetical protein